MRAGGRPAHRAATETAGSTRGAAISAGFIGVSTVSTIGATALLVVIAPPSVVADMAVLTVVATLLSTIFRLGIDRTIVAEISAAEASGGHRAGQVRAAELIRVAAFTSVVGVLVTMATPLANALNTGLKVPLSGVESIALGVWVFAESLRFVIAEACRADHAYVSAAVASYGLRAPLYALGLLALRLASGHVGREAAVNVGAAASVAALCWGVVRSRSTLRYIVHRGGNGTRRQIIASWPMLLATVAAIGIGGADIWIANATTSTNSAATYALAVSAVAPIATLSVALNGGLSPQLARGLATGEADAAIRHAVRLVRLTSYLAAFAYVLLLVGARPVATTLGGEAYDQIGLFVAILGLGQVLSTIAGISGYVLTSGRRYRTVAASTVAVGLIGIALEAIGGVGYREVTLIAVASSTATAALPLVNNLLSRRYLGIRTDAFAR